MQKRLHLFFMLLLSLPLGMLAAGTEWSSATQLPIGQNTSGQLSHNRGEEWWKFTVTADGSVTISVTPGNGLSINDVRLYYTNDNQTDCWQRTSNTYYMIPNWYAQSFTTPDLTAGTYLLKVQRGEGEGSYVIRADFAANPYTNNQETDGWAPKSDNKPCILPLDTPVQGHLGYGYVSGGEDSEDWYTFEVTQDGEATIGIYHDGTLRVSDIRLYYYNSEQTDCWQRTDDIYYFEPGWYAGSMTTRNLAPGTYLIRLTRGEGWGGYELRYTFKPNGYANNREKDGWNPNTDERPCVLPLNSPVQGHLGYGYTASGEDNEDWYTFYVAQDGAATIGINHDGTLRISDIRLYYYNSEKTDCWQRTDDTYYFEPGWYAGSMSIPCLAPGTYLLKLTRGEGWGGYELSYTFSPQAFKNDAEPNNAWSEGRDNNYLARGQEKQGHLGYGYANKGEDNEDWYRIRVPRDGKVVLTYTTISVNSALRVDDVRLYYMNAEKTDYWQRTSNTYYFDPSWYSGSMTIPDMAPGDYLVKVHRGEGYGAYVLKYEFVQDEIPNDAEPNNEWKQPTKLPEGKTLSGHLGYGYVTGGEDSYDWYEVTMPKTGTLKINILPGANLRISDVRLYYYSEGKTDYYQRTKGNYYIEPGWYFGSLITEDVEAGDYLVRVQRGEGYGNYRIAFNADITDVEKQEPLPEEPFGGGDNPGGDPSSAWEFVVHLKTGGTVGYALSTKPKVTLSGDVFTLSTTQTTVTYQHQEVEKFTLEIRSTVDIQETLAEEEQQPQVLRQPGQLTFSGCRPNETIRIYSVGGQLLQTVKTNADGYAEVQTDLLPAGVYIVKSDSITLKVAKR